MRKRKKEKIEYNFYPIKKKQNDEPEKCAHCGKILGNMTFHCPGVKDTGSYCSTKCGNAACETAEIKQEGAGDE